jgi:hypothetical protein
MAIGTIKKLSLEGQKTKEALQILAIAYYHQGRLNDADEIWNKLKISN